MSTDRHDNEELVAQHLVDELADRLAQQGYHFVCITVAKVIPSGKGSAGLTAPGASVINMHPFIAPALPNLARALRSLADMADDAFKRSGAGAATESFSYVVKKEKL